MLGLLLTSSAFSAANSAGSTIRLEFPELEPSLAMLARTEAPPIGLTAVLPDDYSESETYPLLVFLDGGGGGQGDRVDLARQIAGDDSYICVNMPLFKENLDRSERHGGILISMDDHEILSKNFRLMLEGLEKVIPNIRREGSVLGGFSNGAHATGVLLAHSDEFILSRFDHFIFVEGGFGPLIANTLQKSIFASCRFLLLYGDAPGEDGSSRFFSDIAKALEKSGRRNERDVIAIPMRGYGHKKPLPYLRLAGDWLRGDDILAKAAEIPPKPSDQ